MSVIYSRANPYSTTTDYHVDTTMKIEPKYSTVYAGDLATDKYRVELLAIMRAKSLELDIDIDNEYIDVLSKLAKAPKDWKPFIAKLKAGKYKKGDMLPTTKVAGQNEGKLLGKDFHQDVRTLFYLLNKVDSTAHKDFVALCHQMRNLDNPALHAAFTPAVDVPDDLSENKVRNAFAKNKVLSMVRQGYNTKSILEFLDTLYDTKTTAQFKPVINKITIEDDGQILYDGQKILTYVAGPVRIFTLMGAKLEWNTVGKDKWILKYQTPYAKKPASAYLAGDVKEMNSGKWEGVEQLMKVRPALMKEARALRKAGDPVGAIIEFLYHTAARLGSVKKNELGEETGGGPIALRWQEHAVVTKKRVLVKYSGKGQGGKSVFQEHAIPNEAPTLGLYQWLLKKLLSDRALAAKNGLDINEMYVFGSLDKSGNPVPLSPTPVRAFIKKYAPDASPHKFRHVKGTELAIAELNKVRLPENVTQTQAKKLFDAAIEAVGKELGHYNIKVDGEAKISVNTAVKSYIDPNVTLGFFKRANVEVPKTIMNAVKAAMTEK